MLEAYAKCDFAGENVLTHKLRDNKRLLASKQSDIAYLQHEVGDVLLKCYIRYGYTKLALLHDSGLWINGFTVIK